MEDYLFDAEDSHLSPAVTVMTAVLVLTFVLGFAYRLFVVLG
jgi:hypothetical protein